MTYIWEEKKKIDKNEAKGLATELNNIPSVLAEILIQREVNTFQKARNFFRPDMGNLHDPFLMKDMEIACERVISAIKNDEKIRIYGDYDVDGVTSVSMVYEFLQQYHKKIDYYIPDRYEEGYGISIKGIDDAYEKGITLIIALDCGIKAVEKIKYAKSKGVEFIICDHHEAGDELPPAAAVLDPKRADCEYPYKGLSGCGVGFKLLQAFCIKLSIDFFKLLPCLDLLVVSIAADIVPITGENRILAFHGLKRLNEKPRMGIRSILALDKIEHPLTISDIVFKIAPKINAAGRLQSASSAVELLLSSHWAEADKAGKYIKEQNNFRKDIDKEITANALQMIEDSDPQKERSATVLHNPDWHKGVVGIVASRVMEKYYRPTIILTSSNGFITGSARSVKGFNVYEAIVKCEHLLEQYGGHMYAAGLTLKEENLQAFIQEFEEVVGQLIEPHQKEQSLEIDSILPLKDLNEKFFRILRQFAPFGPGNLNPLFKSSEVLACNLKVVGKDHLKLQVFDPNDPTRLINAIAFGFGHLENEIDTGVPFDMVYTVETNYWAGRSSMQLNIKDIQL